MRLLPLVTISLCNLALAATPDFGLISPLTGSYGINCGGSGSTYQASQAIFDFDEKSAQATFKVAACCRDGNTPIQKTLTKNGLLQCKDGSRVTDPHNFQGNYCETNNGWYVCGGGHTWACCWGTERW